MLFISFLDFEEVVEGEGHGDFGEVVEEMHPIVCHVEQLVRVQRVHGLWEMWGARPCPNG